MAIYAFVLSVASLSSTTRGWEFSWVPVDSDGPFTLAGSDNRGEPTEIILDEGPAYIVEFELRVNGWANAPGSPTLGTAQASVNGQGLLGVNASPSNPGVDLIPLNNQGWREAVGGFGLNDGVFMVTDTCHDFTLLDSGLICKSDPAATWDPCPTGVTLCLNRDDWVFAGNVAAKGVSTATDNYVWGGVTAAGVCTFDPSNADCTGPGTPSFCCTGAGTGNCPGSYYLGTLVLNVPSGARGSYTFGFDPSIAYTFINDCAGNALPDLGLAKTPGKITLVGATGKCCFNTRIDPQCVDSVTEFDCNAEPAPRFFTLGATCGGAADECAIDCNGVAVSNGGQVPGDSTGDGLVTLDDYSLVRSGICRLFGPEVPHTPGCEFLDFDCDGDFDLRDFSGFQHVFGPE